MNGVAWVGNHLCNEVAKHIWLQRLNFHKNDLLLLGQILVLEGSAKRRVCNTCMSWRRAFKAFASAVASYNDFTVSSRWSLSQSYKGIPSWAAVVVSKRDLHAQMRVSLLTFAWDRSQIG